MILAKWARAERPRHNKESILLTNVAIVMRSSLSPPATRSMSAQAMFYNYHSLRLQFSKSRVRYGRDAVILRAVDHVDADCLRACGACVEL